MSVTSVIQFIMASYLVFALALVSSTIATYTPLEFTPAVDKSLTDPVTRCVQVTGQLPYYGREVFNVVVADHIFKPGFNDFPYKEFQYHPPSPNAVFTNVILTLDGAYESLSSSVLAGLYFDGQEIWRFKLPATARKNVRFTQKKDLSRYVATFRQNSTFGIQLYANSTDVDAPFIGLTVRADFYNSHHTP